MIFYYVLFTISILVLPITMSFVDDLLYIPLVELLPIITMSYSLFILFNMKGIVLSVIILTLMLVSERLGV